MNYPICYHALQAIVYLGSNLLKGGEWHAEKLDALSSSACSNGLRPFAGTRVVPFPKIDKLAIATHPRENSQRVV